jgi:hypothetical protein
MRIWAGWPEAGMFSGDWTRWLDTATVYALGWC